MPLSNAQLTDLIQANILDNTQQMVTPARVREVMLEMLAFADFVRSTGDTLDGVTTRGNISNRHIVLGTDQFLGWRRPEEGVIISALDGNQTTVARNWILPDEDGTLATREWALENITGGGGGGPIALTTLTDVTITTPSTGQLLRFDGTEWVNWTPTFAAASHGHIIGDVTGLQTALDGKAATSHGHIISDVTGLQTALDGKQAAGSYAAASHGHIIADVTGLQTALDGKQAAGSYAAASHSHGLGDITGFPSQTGQSGKYLTTDGTDLSWAIVAASSPAGATGNVQFRSAGGELAAVSTFTYDSTNNRVGIGTASPLADLHIVGSRIRMSGSTNTGLDLYDGASAAWGFYVYNGTYGSGTFGIYNSSLGAAIDISKTTNQILLTGATVFNSTANFKAATTIEGGAGANVGLVIKAGTDKWKIANYTSGGESDKFSIFNYASSDAFVIRSDNKVYIPGSLAVGSTTPTDASAVLEAKSTTQGFLPPRMTKTQRNAISSGSPAAGLLVVATDETAANAISRYNGSAWAGAESDNWVDYSSTTTVVGWSSTTVKIVRYQLMHRKMLVQFDIQGTSNSTTASFTLPFSLGAAGVTTLGVFHCIDLGGAQIGAATISGSTVSFSRYVAVDDGGSFTASGTKGVRGQFFIELD